MIEKKEGGGGRLLFRVLFPQKIHKLLFSFFFLGMLIPLIAVSVIFFNFSSNLSEKRTLDYVSDVADFNKAKFEHEIVGFKSAMVFAQDFYNVRFNLPKLSSHVNDSKNGEFVSATEMLDSQLVTFQNMTGMVDLELLNSDGIIVYTVNKKYSDYKLFRPSRAVFDRVLFEGGNGLFFSNLSGGKITSHGLTLFLSAPVKALNGSFAGAIVFEIDFSKIYDNLQSSLRLGESAEVIFGRKVNGEFVFLSSLKYRPLAALRYAVKFGSDVSIPMQNAVFGLNGVGIEKDYRDVDVIAAWRFIPVLGWGMVAKVDVADAVRMESVLKYQIILLLLFISIFGLFVAVFVSQYFSVPFESIFSVAKELAQGNFNSRVVLSMGGDWGELAVILNKAISDLGRLDFERKKLDEVKTRFLSIIGHELRSPMTPMRAQLQMLLDNYFGTLNHKQRLSLDMILRNAIRLDSVIQDLLEISRIESARLKFNFVKADLTQYVLRTIRETDNYLPERNIKIIPKIEKLPVIDVDPDRVMQVLRNLLRNAKQFSYDGGKVFVSVSVKNNHVLFAVRDQGIGISAEHKADVFEPFVQEKREKFETYGVAGLGLSICRALVEAQHGRIWFETNLNKGSTFYFTVPLKPVRTAKQISGLFFLIADFEAKARNVFKKYLGPLGDGEFDNLRAKGLNRASILNYLKNLEKNGVISLEVFDAMYSELYQYHQKNF